MSPTALAIAKCSFNADSETSAVSVSWAWRRSRATTRAKSRRKACAHSTQKRKSDFKREGVLRLIHPPPHSRFSGTTDYRNIDHSRR